MSKKGGSNHYIRMRADKRLGVVGRKSVMWLLAPNPGKHKKSESISAGVLMRDVLCRVQNLHEAKKIMNSGNFLVDGKKVKEPKYSIGLMDIITEVAEKKSYRMSLDGPKLVPKEVKSESAEKKYLKATGKATVTGGKTQITFHDGRTYLGDKNIHTGDTCVFAIPSFKLAGHLKFAPGARCLVTQGKHIGEIAKLDKVIARPGSHESEAQLSGDSGEFVTLVKYLFVVDEKF
ncbi:30S ribosomal protein S4e [uncultured archaeon]|nr:30S ribosomal protein S4e [uncultured archaeon]